MRLLITGGGTGGHLYPALAVAELLKEKDPEGEILFVGTGNGIESYLVPLEGYPFREISAVKWPRRLSWQAWGVFPSLWKGYCEGSAIIKEFHPGAVFATGGYVSVPLALAAVRHRLPIYLHEQNSVPGMANRLLARWARTIFTTFPPEQASFPSRAKLVYSGLPIRKDILAVNKSEGLAFFGFSNRYKTILVTGGSGGARAINQTMLAVYRSISQKRSKLPQLQVIHLTGKRDYETYCQQMAKEGINIDRIGTIVIKPYLEEMAAAMAAADLIISRAGAATLAEITARGIASILIPYPFATGNHQYHNARFLAREGAAVLIPEGELSADKLLQKMELLVNDDILRRQMADSARGFGKPSAASIIVRELLQER